MANKKLWFHYILILYLVLSHIVILYLPFFLFRFTGTTSECINLGSYNYLGFAEANGKCADQSIETLKKFGCASCSSRLELGNEFFSV